MTERADYTVEIVEHGDVKVQVVGDQVLEVDPADAGKAIIVQGDGTLAPEPLPTVVTDHGALTGLGDDDHTQYTTTAEAQALVDTAINTLVTGAPAALNTLDELAAALGDDANYASTITTALAGKQPLDADLTAIAALVSAANKLAYATGAGTWSLTDLTAFARTLLDDADAAAARTTLGLGTAATAATGDFQPVDADLTAIAALATTAFGRDFLTLADHAALVTKLALVSADISDLSQVAANTQTADYTLVLGDAGKIIEMNKATAVTLTIPTNASVAFAVGTVVEVYQMGAGQVTVAAAGGVTLNAPHGPKTFGQYSTCGLRKRATNEWVLSGDTQA